jgi:hypothetical protein
MTQEDAAELVEAPRRFDVELFIVHPTIDPTAISNALGLEACFSHRAGDPRTTPTGAPLRGKHPDTRWRHSMRCIATDQWFAAHVTQFVDRLEPHKAYFANLKSTGGTACVIIQFLGDGYLGDDIPTTTLAKLVALDLSLAIECFIVRQR